MKKENLEKFKELYKVIEEKATDIALLKNKYAERPFKYWDETKFDCDCGEFGVKLI